MASAAGILFGLNFVPVIYIKNNYPKQNEMHGMWYIYMVYVIYLVINPVCIGVRGKLKKRRGSIF